MKFDTVFITKFKFWGDVQKSNKLLFKLMLVIVLFLSFSVNAVYANDIYYDRGYIVDTSEALYGIAYNGVDKYVAVGKKGTIKTSRDRKTWYNVKPVCDGNIRKIIWDGSKFLAVGDFAILISKDGSNWEAISAMASLGGLDWSGFTYVAVGEYNIIQTSEDGIEWKQRKSPVNTACWEDVVWNGNQFVAVSREGFIITSPDGIEWTRRDSGTQEYLFGIAWNGNEFIAVGNTILTSEDGINWINRTPPEYDTRYNNYILLWHVTCNHNTTVIVGDFGVLLTSKDNINWELRRSGSTVGMGGLIWDGKNFIGTDEVGSLIVSDDGYTWSTYSTITDVDDPNQGDYKIKYGDVDGDGKINLTDLVLMKRYILGIYYQLPDSYNISNADLNGDNNINSIDLAILNRYVLGTIKKLPYSY